MPYRGSWMVSSQAEVSDLDMVMRVQENVDRLQISMYHTLRREAERDHAVCTIIP